MKRWTIVLQTALSIGFLLATTGIGTAQTQPTLSKVEPTADGYALVGRGLGSGRVPVRVFEGAIEVTPGAVLSVTDGRVTVRSKPSGRIEHKVQVGAQASNTISFTHDGPKSNATATPAAAPRSDTAAKPAAAPTLAAPRMDDGVPPKSVTAGAALPTGGKAPALSAVERAPEGYALRGGRFGTDKAKVQLFQGPNPVPADLLVSLADDRIVVRSRPSGTVQHRVVVDGQGSAVVGFDHSGAPQLVSLTLSEAQVGGGRGVIGTVTLSNHLPGGAVVSLSQRGDGAVTIPASVTVDTSTSGDIVMHVVVTHEERSKTFSINTSPVSKPTVVEISATYNGVVKTAALQIRPLELGAILLLPNQGPMPMDMRTWGAAPPLQIVGGDEVRLIAATSSPLISSATMAISSNSPSAPVPSSTELFPPGYTEVLFTTQKVTAPTQATISATYGGVTKTARLNLVPMQGISIAVTPESVEGGRSVTGTVTLNGPAPVGGAVVQLTKTFESSGPYPLDPAVMPASVVVWDGSRTATFAVSTGHVNHTTRVTIKSTYLGFDKQATVEVRPSQ